MDDKRMFIAIPAEGDAYIVDATDKNNGEVIRKIVDGWYQCIDLSPDLAMWMNEEGKNLNLPHNERAQFIWDSRFGEGTDYIVGNVVLTGGVDDEGETLGLAEPAVDRLINLIMRAMIEMVGRLD